MITYGTFDIDSVPAPSDHELELCGTDDARRIAARLRDPQIRALIAYWMDGYCPQCGTAIPLDHILCMGCLGDAMRAWGIKEAQ